MRVFPDAKVQTLAECNPGQLVRSLYYGQAETLAIVCSLEEEAVQGLVYLTGEPASYEVVKSPQDFSVLAYRGKLFWEIDQSGPIETNARNLFDKPGCAICDKTGWYLNARFHRGFHGQRRQLNLADTNLGPYVDRYERMAAFGAWSVYLEEPDRRYDSRLEMASFRIDSEA